MSRRAATPGAEMRRALIAAFAIPLLVMSPIPESPAVFDGGRQTAGHLAQQQADSVSVANPDTISAREELERMQKQNGLTISIVSYEGIGVLNFKKRAFAFRTLGFKGN